MLIVLRGVGMVGSFNLLFPPNNVLPIILSTLALDTLDKLPVRVEKSNVGIYIYSI